MRRENQDHFRQESEPPGTAAIRRFVMRREYDFKKARRGAVAGSRVGKTRITIRLDDEVLSWFKDQAHQAGGGSYQRLINEALREHIARAEEPLEEILRRVLREELHQAG